LADCYALYGFYGVGSPQEAAPRGRAAALTALQKDDTLAEAYTALAWIKFTYDRDWPGAEKEFKQAIKLSPHDGLPVQRHSTYLSAMGRTDDGIAEAMRARAIEPLSLNVNAQVVRKLYYGRRWEQAIREAGTSLDLGPNYAQTHLYLGWVYEQQGRYEEAIAELQKGRDLSGGESEMAGALGHAYAVSGKRGEAEKALVDLKERSTQQYVAPFDIAVIYMGLGDKKATFEWLDKAYEDRSTWLTWIKVDPRFESIRDDPRYRDLLRRMNLPE
jgi:tetratricopeptide (TPR) repeat protein